MDLAGEEVVGPIDDEERATILGLVAGSEDREPIDVYVPVSAEDARSDTSIPGAAVHHCTPTTSPPTGASRSRLRPAR